MAEFIGNEYTYLFPGELIITMECMKICTVLGSCVSVCLFDPLRHIAGINHFLLPCNKSNSDAHFKYGDDSLKHLLDHMFDMGATKGNMTAEIYGGSSMFSDTINCYNIGQQNQEIAIQFIEKQGLYVRKAETGGSLGRKIVFDTNTGIINCYMLQGHSKHHIARL